MSSSARKLERADGTLKLTGMLLSLLGNIVGSKGSEIDALR